MSAKGAVGGMSAKGAVGGMSAKGLQVPCWAQCHATA